MSNKRKHADTVIKNHILWSMGAGFIPIAFADIVAVSAVHVDMIRQLCKVYDIDFEETQGKALVSSVTGSAIARAGAASAVKLIPGLGSLLGGATQAVFAGASAYALGEVFKKHFETGGTFLDFDPSRLRALYKEKFEKGKQVAKDLQKRQEAEKAVIQKQKETIVEEKITQGEPAPKNLDTTDVLQQLKDLGKLRADGIITKKEFEKMKAKIVGEL